ncbi:hypothetical protein CHARACLAT_025280 [Characodon lateralis]|uniref:Uncharacterized protein n=1 Tax=Characodon lateralis TaxID=208331 RepID=A0ABU7D3P5_9TELE|nr:hypothetical protein [Characodon lateralis]
MMVLDAELPEGSEITAVQLLPEIRPGSSNGFWVFCFVERKHGNSSQSYFQDQFLSYFLLFLYFFTSCNTGLDLDKLNESDKQKKSYGFILCVVKEKLKENEFMIKSS